MFISVGYGGSVNVLEISAIGPPDSAPIKKRRREAKSKGFLIDFTKGKPARSILFLENHEVLLSAFQPETLVSRVNEEFLFISVGYGAYVAVSEISAIGPPDGSQIKKRRREAKSKGFLIDFTRGHPTRSILFLKNHEVVLAAFQPKTLLKKLGAFKKGVPHYDDDFNLEKE